MYTLRLLGAVDLRGPDGRRVGSVLSQPKRLALLAVLALESPRELPRDELTALLWPEMPDERARSALRQSLYYLRRSLGPEVITGKGGDGVGLEPGALECDVRSLLGAADEGRWADVVRLHAGELMPAFHLNDAPAPFEEWLDGRRRRVERRTLECAWRLADEEMRRGRLAEAAVVARRAWELGPWGEAALQKLLRILVSAGDVVGARAAYEEFAGRLEAEEQRAPRAATRQILDGAADAGGSAPDPEPGVEDAATGAPEATSRPTPAPASSPAPSRATAIPAWLGYAAALAVIVSLGWVLLGRGSSGGPADAGVAAASSEVHLEPVRDLTGDGRSSPRAEATTTELASALAEGGATVVLGEEPSPGASVRLRPTLQEAGGDLILSVLVLDGPSGAVLDRLTTAARDSAAGGLDPEAMAVRMAADVRRSVGEILSWRGLAAQRIHPTALEAIRSAAEELVAARDLRRQGAREAAALGYQAVDSLLQRSRRLAPDWVEPPARRAELELERVWLYLVPPYRDPEVAHRTILRGLSHADTAVSVEPGARALDVRGNLLYWASATALDSDAKARYREAAERTLVDAVRLDEDRSAAWSLLSALAERRGDHALAYHRARKSYATDRALRVSTETLARLYTNALEVGDDVAAARWCREARLQIPRHWLGPFCDLTRLAWLGPWSEATADSLVREGLEKVPDHAGRPLIEARFRLTQAVVLARAGQGDAARQLVASVPETAGGVQLLDLEAWVLTALGETGQARRLLAEMAQRDPAGARGVLQSGRFRDLPPFAVVRAEE